MPSLIASFFRRNVTLNMGATEESRPQTAYSDRVRWSAPYRPVWTGYDTPVQYQVDWQSLQSARWTQSYVREEPTPKINWDDNSIKGDDIYGVFKETENSHGRVLKGNGRIVDRFSFLTE